MKNIVFFNCTKIRTNLSNSNWISFSLCDFIAQVTFILSFIFKLCHFHCFVGFGYHHVYAKTMKGENHIESHNDEECEKTWEACFCSNDTCWKNTSTSTWIYRFFSVFVSNSNNRNWFFVQNHRHNYWIGNFWFENLATIDWSQSSFDSIQVEIW